MMTIKKVMTFKAGKFVFSSSYSEDIIKPLLLELDILYQTIKDLPILPALSVQLESELIRRSIFSTAAIEGNPLKEEAVGHILDDPDKEALLETREREITNLKYAYDIVKNLSVSDSVPLLDEQFIKSIHGVITKGIKYEQNIPGYYRNHIVKVGDKNHGGVYTPPKCLDDIKNLMQEYVSWINSEDLISEPILRAALAHYYLGLIHPFADGNGRTARIIEAALLKMSGKRYIPTMLSNYYYQYIDEYFITFSVTRKDKQHNVTQFLTFMLKASIESLREIKRRITFYIRKFTLRDYYNFLVSHRKLTRRQNELLLSLLENDEQYSFSFNDLFVTPPFRALYTDVSERTARRDLKKLHSLELLDAEQARYLLNWRVLDAI